jgi:hypothetical protein
MSAAHALYGSLRTRAHQEQLLTRYGEGRHPSDLAHRMVKQPVARHPAPQHHHPQCTSCQPSHETQSWNRGSQHYGVLPGPVGCSRSVRFFPSYASSRTQVKEQISARVLREQTEADKDSSTQA